MFSIFSSNKVKSINVNDLDGVLGKINLIDIREPYEFKAKSLNSSLNIPMGKLTENPELFLDLDEEYHIICQSGGRSARACSMLIKDGYKVVNVSGGIGSYAGVKIK